MSFGRGQEAEEARKKCLSRVNEARKALRHEQCGSWRKHGRHGKCGGREKHERRGVNYVKGAGGH